MDINLNFEADVVAALNLNEFGEFYLFGIGNQRSCISCARMFLGFGLPL